MSTHKCPSPTCNRQVAYHMYACRAHWYQLPKPIRDDIWRGYDQGPLSDAHVAAMNAAEDWYADHAATNRG